MQAHLLEAAVARQRAAAEADAAQAAAQVAPPAELLAMGRDEEALAAGLAGALVGGAAAEPGGAERTTASRLTAAAQATVASAPEDANAYHVAAQLMHGAVGSAAASPSVASSGQGGHAQPNQPDAERGGGGDGGHGAGHVDLAQVDPGTAADLAPMPPMTGAMDSVWARPDADPAAGIRTGSLGRFDADEQAAIKAYVRRLREER